MLLIYVLELYVTQLYVEWSTLVTVYVCIWMLKALHFSDVLCLDADYTLDKNQADS